MLNDRIESFRPGVPLREVRRGTEGAPFRCTLPSKAGQEWVDAVTAAREAYNEEEAFAVVTEDYLAACKALPSCADVQADFQWHTQQGLDEAAYHLAFHSAIVPTLSALVDLLHYHDTPAPYEAAGFRSLRLARTPTGHPHATFLHGRLVYHVAPYIPFAYVAACSAAASCRIPSAPPPYASAYRMQGFGILVLAATDVTAQDTSPYAAAAAGLYDTMCAVRGACSIYCTAAGELIALPLKPLSSLVKQGSVADALETFAALDEPQDVLSVLRAKNLCISDLPLLLKDGGPSIKQQVITEMVAQAVCEAQSTEVAEAKSEEGTMQQCNRLLQSVLINASCWGSVVVPLVCAVFSDTDPRLLEWGIYIGRGSRQGLLRRLCNVLGVVTSKQVVAGVFPVRTSLSRVMPYDVSMYQCDLKGREAVLLEALECVNTEKRAKAKLMYTAFTKLVSSQPALDQPFVKLYFMQVFAEWHAQRADLKQCADMYDSSANVVQQMEGGALAATWFRVLKVHFDALYNGYEDHETLLPESERVLCEVEEALQSGTITEPAVYRKLLKVLVCLYRGYTSTEKLSQAETHCLRAVVLVESRDASAEDCEVVTDLANIYMAAGRLEEAEHRFRQVIERYMTAFGTQHPDTATAMNNLACLHYNRALKAQGRRRSSARRPVLKVDAHRYLAEAKDLLQRVVAIPEEVLEQVEGEDALLADALNNLGSVNFLLGHYDEAERTCLRSYEISVAAFGADHVKARSAQKNLDVMRHRRRSQAARHIQAVYKGYKGRKIARKRKTHFATLRRVGRGFCGRRLAAGHTAAPSRGPVEGGIGGGADTSAVRQYHEGNTASSHSDFDIKSAEGAEAEAGAVVCKAADGSAVGGDAVEENDADKVDGLGTVAGDSAVDSAAKAGELGTRGGSAGGGSGTDKDIAVGGSDTRGTDDAASELEANNRADADAVGTGKQPGGSGAGDEAAAGESAAGDKIAASEPGDGSTVAADAIGADKAGTTNDVGADRSAGDIEDKAAGGPEAGNKAVDRVGVLPEDMQLCDAQHNAATRIQARHRGNVGRQKAARQTAVRSSHIAEQHAAATKIQARHRGTIGRERAANKAAMQKAKGQTQAQTMGSEQAKTHEVGAGTELQLQAAAATKIQARHRGNMGRQKAAEEKAEAGGQAAEAARSGVEGSTERKASGREAVKTGEEGSAGVHGQKAAVKIQARHRGNMGRQKAAMKKAEVNTGSATKADDTSTEVGQQNAAAAKIQARHRGNLGRQRAAKKKAEAGTKGENNTAAEPEAIKAESTAGHEVEQQNAAAKIQARHRGNKGRQKAAEKKAEVNTGSAATKTGDTGTEMGQQNAAAAKIQARHRGNLGRRRAARRKAEADYTAVGKEPEAIKAESTADHEVERQNAAAAKIQARHRGNMGRQKAAEKKAEVGAKQGKAVGRGSNGTSAEAEQNAAATKIQARHRGNVGRQKVAKKKAEARTKGECRPAIDEVSEPAKYGTGTEAERQKAAATKIQARHRGNEGRKRTALQRTERAKVAGSLKSAADLEREATAQSKSRSKLEQQNAAATKIQARHRGNVGRQKAAKKAAPEPKGGSKETVENKRTSADAHVEVERQNAAAAAKIQARHRGNMGRQRAVEKRNEQGNAWGDKRCNPSDAEQARAATKIQALHRGRQGRMQVQRRAAAQEEGRRRAQAATKIQAIQRGKVGRAVARETQQPSKEAKKRAETLRRKTLAAQLASRIEAEVGKTEDDARLRIEIEEAKERHSVGMAGLEDKYRLVNKDKKRQGLETWERQVREAVEEGEVALRKKIARRELVVRVDECLLAHLDSTHTAFGCFEFKKRRELARREKLVLKELKEREVASRQAVRERARLRTRTLDWNARHAIELNGNDTSKTEERKRLYLLGKKEEQRAREARQEARRLEIELRARQIRDTSKVLKATSKEQQELTLLCKEERVKHARREKHFEGVLAPLSPPKSCALTQPFIPSERSSPQHPASRTLSPMQPTVAHDMTDEVAAAMERREKDLRLSQKLLFEPPQFLMRHAEDNEIVDVFYKAESGNLERTSIDGGHDQTEPPTGSGPPSPLGVGGAALEAIDDAEIGTERSSGDGKEVVIEWNRTASMLARNGDYSQAAVYLKKANIATLESNSSKLVFISKEERLRLRATTLNNVACLYKRLKNFHKALEYLTVVRSLESSIKDESPATLLNLSAVHAALEEPLPALGTCRCAMRMLLRRVYNGMTPPELMNAKLLIIVMMHNLAAAQAISPNEVSYAYGSYSLAHEMARSFLGPSHQTTQEIGTALADFKKKSNRVFYSNGTHLRLSKKFPVAVKT